MKVPREQLWVGKWVVDFVPSPHNDYASGLASRSRAMDLLGGTQAIRLISPFRIPLVAVDVHTAEMPEIPTCACLLGGVSKRRTGLAP